MNFKNYSVLAVVADFSVWIWLKDNSKRLISSCLKNLCFVLNLILWGEGREGRDYSQDISPLCACLHWSHKLGCGFMLLLFIITTTTCMGFGRNCVVEMLRVVTEFEQECVGINLIPGLQVIQFHISCFSSVIELTWPSFVSEQCL